MRAELFNFHLNSAKFFDACLVSVFDLLFWVSTPVDRRRKVEGKCTVRNANLFVSTVCDVRII